ncbi:transcription elongation factor SPT6 isoform X3 [Lingula anatina]|uniref:Transcription elongation factor SPT6 n=1 Tax=Lingula anatina TaxID=7574 RepID=A0A1S3IH00_LINAN|nr:transcription elongation factor SPT6 isoform X3 [Lingula anatina]|eukprot:XP_013397141.1 transcription elongation factor SPT6 isoform X3 [Lingula anatina]
MSDFMDDEASVSSGSEDASDDEQKKPDKKKKSKKQAINSDSEDSDEEEEEEDDDDKIREEMKDLINDEEEEEEGPASEDEKKEDSDIDDQLEEDDYDLIEENLGIKVQRKRKHTRIRVLSDDEDSDKDDEPEAKKGKETIANQIFEGDDDDLPDTQMEETSQQEPEEKFGELEESEEESDVDDFIVDDEGQPISKTKKKKHIIHTDSALQEAQDIFGVDFDFADFDQYGSEYEEDELEEEYEEEMEGEEGTVKPKKKTSKKRAKKSIFEVYEPSELEKAHLTDVDNEIRTTDMPERFQLRGIPVLPTEEGELEEEAEWIYKHAFCTQPLSSQDQDGGEGQSYYNRKGPSTVVKIKEALHFMRNDQLEVPFIAFYRKEYVNPELNIKDLWKVWQWDEKWTQLRSRKKNLVRLFEKMQQYQFELIDPEKPLPSHFRSLTSDDIERAKNIQSMEEYKDVYQHFLLYYGADIPKMKNAEKKKKKTKPVKEKEPEKDVEVEGDGEKEEGETEEGEEEKKAKEPEEEEEEEEDNTVHLKQATRKTGYTLCCENGLAEVACKFGLTPEQFGENLRDNYQRHEVEQYPLKPLDVAKDFIVGVFNTEEDVLKGARHVVAMQIAHDPLVREVVRETFFERATIDCRPTKKGIKMIDEAHPCYTCKYLRHKPTSDLQNEQFLKMVMAEEDQLLTMDIGLHDKDAYFDDIKQLFYRDEFSSLVQEWNNQRSLALERALKVILFPQMAKELKTKLIQEAKDGVVQSCARKLYNWLKVAPYQTDQPDLDDDDDDYSKGLRVLGIGFAPDRETAAFGALIDGDGEVTEYIRLPHLLKMKGGFREMDSKQKREDLEKLKDFISTKKPHVIAVAADSLPAKNIIEDLQELVTELEQEQQMAPINVELVDNELALIYECCNKAESDFRDYPPLLRQAISVARRLQDPLIEFAQMFNTDEDILCLKYHPLQDQVSKDDLLNALNLEFVNRVNEVGVDVNRAVAHSHTSHLVQFVCGLGPRKGAYLLKILKQNNARLENRTQLVTLCHMGPKVFINCAGFIKIDTNSLGDSTDAYVEVLDGSRVHPETYDWARKMAVDALEYDDTAEDANPAGALEEILESPERLKDLDLDAFAEELERQNYGNKHITLYDIRAELNHRYKDLRTPYRPPSEEERFNMLTKETPQTFYIGKLIMCRVNGFAFRKPHGDQLDQANPVRNDETGLWQCPFCMTNDFPELSEVWSHFDAGSCPGTVVGVKVRLDNGCRGFLPNRNISDKHVTNPEERVKNGMILHSRITKINIERFEVEVTCRTSDLVDKEGTWRPAKDRYYDIELEEADMKKEDDKKKLQARQTYIKRVIVHPSFHNIDFRTCEKLMANMDQGEVIIRPSSKGADHLTVTWKVTEGVYSHIDVKEDGKENAFSLGQSLLIGNDEFEDLDEIIARHIQPMAAFARDIINFKYYKEVEGGKRENIEKILIEEKKKGPSKIPYYFSVAKELPGKFMLSYLPRTKPKHEFVTVTPDGMRYRGQVFHSLNSLIKWFKEHFRDPPPGTPASTRTPLGLAATPSINLHGVDAATLRQAAAGLPSNIYSTLAQVAGATPRATPQIGSTPQSYQTARNFAGGYSGGYNLQPTATPLLTPMMTPSYHTSQGLGTTPLYQPTPRTSNWPGNTPRQQASATTPRVHPATTPRQQPGLTPRQQPGITPRQQPGLTPRQSGMTPRHSHSHTSTTPRQSGATPTRTHGSSSGSTPSGRTPTHSSRSSSKAATVTDWAKAAEMWAKKRANQGYKTPQSDVGSTTPAGDSTPLIDER